MTSSQFDLSNKVAIVTGAAQGMGRAMSMALAEAGADLLLVDRNEAGVRQTAASIAELGRHAGFAVHDVSEPKQVRALFQRLDADFGA
jgi:2-deoxy-D-gluconate 3-dehydrogenase